MANGFVHSEKVPRLYKTAANIVRAVREEGANVKDLVFQKKHPLVKAVYALVLTVLKNGDLLNHLLIRTKILLKETRCDPWLTRVLIAELLWGKGVLKSSSKPVVTVLSYKAELEEASKCYDGSETFGSIERKVEKPRYVRVNTLLCTVEDAICSFEYEGYQKLPATRTYLEFLKVLANLSDKTFIQDYHIPELLAFPAGTEFHDHKGYKEGLIILQDKASCLPAYLLNPTPGSVVLDMCAAPGMKTSHLAAILNNQGKIYAVEMNERRYNILSEFLKSSNSYCVEAINGDSLSFDEKHFPDVEFILVDPSCSGSGMLDRVDVGDQAAKSLPERLRSLQSFQVYLLRHALLSFPSAKRIIYSTCSIHAKENEEVIDEILADIGDAYTLVPLKERLNGQWINFSSRDFKCQDSCLYAKSDVDQCNGFFIAMFERNFEVPLPKYRRKGNKRKVVKNNKENQKTENAINGNIETSVLSEEKNHNESDNFEKGVEDATSISNDTSSGKKPKKKRKKHSENEVLAPNAENNVPEGNENLENEELSPKKKYEVVEVSEESIAINEEIGDISCKIKKKKRSKEKSESNVQTNEPCNEDPEEIPVKKSKKKKYKKKKDIEVIEIDNIEELDVTEKICTKKKHKKVKDVEVIEINNIEELDVTEKSCTKRKHKKVKDATEIEVIDIEMSDVGDGEKNDDSHKKSKKKKKHKT